MEERGSNREAAARCIAVVVTYNRLNLLKRTVAGIRSQTHPLDGIVVVNNGSTDGTAEWLEQQRDLTVIHQENLGGAGGFNRGMRHAFEAGADWIWVMDDDVVPESNALALLLEKAAISGCILPSRVYSDGEPCQWGHVFDLKRRTIVFGTRVVDQDTSKEFTFVNTCCFEGMLISRAVVEKAGFPDARFFISWDDTVYGLTVSRVTNPIVARDALLIRAKTVSEARKVSPMFAYYYFRNFHLLEEYYSRLSGGSRYGVIGHLKYIVSTVLFLRKCWMHSRDTFSSVFRSVCRGVIDNYRGMAGRSH